MAQDGDTHGKEEPKNSMHARDGDKPKNSIHGGAKQALRLDVRTPHVQYVLWDEKTQELMHLLHTRSDQPRGTRQVIIDSHAEEGKLGSNAKL